MFYRHVKYILVNYIQKLPEKTGIVASNWRSQSPINDTCLFPSEGKNTVYAYSDSLIEMHSYREASRVKNNIFTPTHFNTYTSHSCAIINKMKTIHNHNCTVIEIIKNIHDHG